MHFVHFLWLLVIVQVSYTSQATVTPCVLHLMTDFDQSDWPVQIVIQFPTIIIVNTIFFYLTT